LKKSPDSFVKVNKKGERAGIEGRYCPPRREKKGVTFRRKKKSNRGGKYSLPMKKKGKAEGINAGLEEKMWLPATS